MWDPANFKPSYHDWKPSALKFPNVEKGRGNNQSMMTQMGGSTVKLPSTQLDMNRRVKGNSKSNTKILDESI